jgi:myosin heavy subunit
MSDIFGGEEIDAPEQEIMRDEPVVERDEAPEPVIEAKEAEAPEQKREIGEQSTVPLAALNESRAQLRQTQAELSQMRQQLQQFEALRQEIEQQRAQTRQQQEESEFNTDPLGAIRKQLGALEQKVAQPVQAQQHVQDEAQLFQAIASQVNEYKKSSPDYDDALQHVIEARRSELVQMGANEYEAQQRVAMEAQEIALNALRSGRNPAAVVYELAKLRGYSAKQVSNKLQTVAKGQEASQSLSGASGGAEKAGLNLAELDQMDDDQFDKWWAKNMRPNSR